MGRFHTHRRNTRAKVAKNAWKMRTATLDAEDSDMLHQLPVQEPSCSHSERVRSASPSDSSFEDIENVMKRNPNWSKNTYKKRPLPRIIPVDEGEYGVISSDEYDSIMNHELCIENESIDNDNEVHKQISGNRIVDLKYVIDQTLAIQKGHTPICPQGTIHIRGELRRGSGLVSIIILDCDVCKREYRLTTENTDKKVSAINMGAVWGTLATGSTFMHMNEFLSCLDIPCMSNQMFLKFEAMLGKKWKDSMWESMEEAGQKEKDHAIENNNLCADGVPWITVYVDGSWAKRSYGTNFNSFSGMVGIIGQFTGEVLYIAVRNKYCSICSRAENKNLKIPAHICYKNWSDSSCSMEPEMAVAGFNLSEEMHGVRYKRFIADGDSSVFAHIIENVSYGHLVEKLECTNHALKNYGKHLRELKKDTKVSVGGRKLLSLVKIQKLTKRAKCSIHEHSKTHNVKLLREDLENGIRHVFGDHSKCRLGICNSVGDTSGSQIPLLKSTMIYDHLKGIINLLVKKAHLLIENENNNRAERLMNIVARFTMGKRLNLIQRGSYERRVHLAGLRYNHSVNWHKHPWKTVCGESPGHHFKNFMESQSARYAHDKIRKTLFPTKMKRKKLNADPGNYGKCPDEPEEDFSCIELQCEKFLSDLQVDSQERTRIVHDSIGQFGNPVYEYERSKRLTASLFGRIMNRREVTPCHGIVKSCLDTSHSIKLSNAVEYGIRNEAVAITLFEKKTGHTVEKCGLWIDNENGFLAASPDGMVGDNGIIEVKCFYASSQLEANSIEEVIEKNKKTCLIKKDGKLMLKRNHPYYYQIQGQLNITQRSLCYFVVYVSDKIDIYVEEIYKDEKLWNEQMLPKLSTFYKECILPEIFLKNIKRRRKCRDPPFILEAIKKAEEKKNM